jgi:hypothetical protein
MFWKSGGWGVGGGWEFTEAADGIGAGDRQAVDELLPHVRHELSRVVLHYMAAERHGHLLQATALVNEAYLRSVEWKDVRWADARTLRRRREHDASCPGYPPNRDRIVASIGAGDLDEADLAARSILRQRRATACLSSR